MDLSDELRLVKTEDQIFLALALPADAFFDDPHRRRLAIDMTRRAARKAGGVETGEDVDAIRFRFNANRQKAVKSLTEWLRVRLAAILNAPLTPKADDRALGITSRERLRWYKDGRLPTCGRAMVGRQQPSSKCPVVPNRCHRPNRCRSANYRNLEGA